MLRGSGKPKKQFQRPSVTVSTEVQDTKKAWQDLDPREVEVGDIILGQGLVVGLGEISQNTDPFEYVFRYEMKNGTTHIHRAHPLWAEESIVPTVRTFSRVRG